MTPQQAMRRSYRYLALTVGFVAVGILVGVLWRNVWDVVHPVLFDGPAIVCATGVAYWRGWAIGSKHRNDQLTRVMHLLGIDYGQITAADMEAELAEQKRQREENR
jgi:hypothetical protein